MTLNEYNEIGYLNPWRELANMNNSSRWRGSIKNELEDFMATGNGCWDGERGPTNLISKYRLLWEFQ